jgi:hypothetical protein
MVVANETVWARAVVSYSLAPAIAAGPDGVPSIAAAGRAPHAGATSSEFFRPHGTAPSLEGLRKFLIRATGPVELTAELI